MKNKFTITISDVKGSKHYSMNQVVKKIAIYFLVSFGLLLAIGVTTILLLSKSVNKLEFKRDAIRAEMLNETARLQKIIDEKMEFYEIVQGRIDEIESAIGIKSYEDVIEDIDVRLENISLTSAQRLFILEMIPNGEVVEHKGVSAPFGMRKHPIYESQELHKGIDYRADLKTKIIAPAQGVIEFAGMHNENGLGSLVIIDHGFGFKTFFAHLDRKMVVKHGQFVKKGEHIANTGNTGLSTGPHLHYEVRFLGYPLNPIHFVKWDITNFEDIFNKDKRIPWASLVNSALQLISKVQKLQ